MKSGVWHRFGAVAATALLVVFMTACGSDDDETDSASADASQPQPTGASGSEATETEEVSILVASPSLSFLGVLTARYTGEFEKAGLDVRWPPFLPNTAQATNTVLTGDADIAFVTTVGPIAALEQDRPIQIFAAEAQGQPTILTLRTDVVEELATEGITPESPVEERLRALRGLRIGTGSPGGSTETLVRVALQEAGLNPDTDLTLQSFGDPPSTYAAMQAGQVDGFAFSPPQSLQPTVDGTGVVWISGPAGDVESWNIGYYSIAATSTDYAKENPGVLEKVAAALDAAHQRIAEDPEAVLTAIREVFPDLSEELLELSISTVEPLYMGSSLKRTLVEENLEQYELESGAPVSVSPKDLVVEGFLR